MILNLSTDEAVVLLTAAEAVLAIVGIEDDDCMTLAGAAAKLTRHLEAPWPGPSERAICQQVRTAMKNSVRGMESQ